MSAASALIPITRRLARATSELPFPATVAYVYQPLVYARTSHEAYLARWGGAPKEALLLGMNPGPFGMMQTGVPFGEVALVRDWLGIKEEVGRPAREHPKRPVQGFNCTRSEVSGARLWGWARDRFGTPERFFTRFFVWNWCPLGFLDIGGRNLTPDKFAGPIRAQLAGACDRAVTDVVAHLRPRIVIGVGAFAESAARRALGNSFPIARIPHPSPASPTANRGWAPQAEAALKAAGISL